MTVIERIDAILQSRNMSRRQLAKAADIPPSSLQSAMERGKNISVDMLEKISNALNISILELIEPTDDVSPLDLLFLPENDIEVKLDEILALLENTQIELTLDGEPLDKTTKELIALSLHSSMQVIQFAKQHLLYKKYEDDPQSEAPIATSGDDGKPEEE